MAKVQLDKGMVAIVDDADIPLVAGFTWCATKKRHTWVARTSVRCEGKQKSVYMHRLIVGAKKGEYVDHRDGEGLNNKRENLRRCTNSENAQNRVRINSRNKSGVHGVFWEKACQKWRVRICKNYKQVHVGVYKTLEQASAAYREASLRMHGEFASSLGREVCHR